MRWILALALLVPLPMLAADAALKPVFERMDRAAATFKGFTADLMKVDHQDFVDATDKSTGTMAVRKTGPHNVQVLEKIVDQNGKPDAEETEFNGTHVLIYHPKLNTATEHEVSKKYRGVEQAALAIFGGSSQDLQRDYKVTYGGPDTVSGQPATRLLLIPIDPELAKTFPKVELWISDATGTAVQQKFYEPGEKDYHLLTYSHMNFGPVSEDQVKIKLPKDVKRERPH